MVQTILPEYGFFWRLGKVDQRIIFEWKQVNLSWTSFNEKMVFVPRQLDYRAI